MNKKTTVELENVLRNMSLKDLEKFASGMYTEGNISLADYLNEYVGQKKLKLPEIFKKALFSRDYGYNIFNGKRTNPTRDRVIALCIAMEMDIDETQRTLKISGNGGLYPKVERDAFLMICIQNKVGSVGDVNDLLVRYGHEPLQTEKNR